MSKPERDGMIFDWSGGHRSSWTLALFIFLSLALHSAAFFFVHISTPERRLIPKTAQPIQILTRYAPDGSPSPENEAMLRWIAAEDPAIVARVSLVEPSGLLNVPHIPSFAVSRTQPRDIPPEPVTIQYPTARNSLDFIMGADEKPKPPAIIPPAMPTELVFHDPLSARFSGDKPLQLEIKSEKSLETVQLLAGVTAEGEVRFCFIQVSSGVREMDEVAVRLVSTVRLKSAAAPVTWATVTVRWGSDAIAAQK